jgi:hypothetical protein
MRKGAAADPHVARSPSGHRRGETRSLRGDDELVQIDVLGLVDLDDRVLRSRRNRHSGERHVLGGGRTPLARSARRASPRCATGARSAAAQRARGRSTAAAGSCHPSSRAWRPRPGAVRRSVHGSSCSRQARLQRRRQHHDAEQCGCHRPSRTDPASLNAASVRRVYGLGSETVI